MKFAQRLQPLQANVYADMDRAKAAAAAAGKEVIDLSLGSSDLPVSDRVISVIEASLHDPSTHGYSLFHSTQPFRRAIAEWYEKKYGIAIDPETEVLPLIGSQEGTGHLPLALLDPGDVALVQDPGYPSHAGGVHLAGGELYLMPTIAAHHFLPVLEDIPPEVRSRAKMMILSYPHNPTAAVAPLAFFEEAVQFCRQHAIVLVHDFPYGDVVFDGQPAAPSIFLADREKSLGIEFYTFSKSYNMGGFRVGYAIGNSELILALRQVKAVIDFNQYRGILQGAIEALTGSQDGIKSTVETFQKRRDAFVTALRDIGWEVPCPQATMYIWAQLPDRWRHDSMAFGVQLVRETGVAVAPGVGYGQAGEGYVRFALVKNIDTLQLAADRIAEFLKTSSLFPT